MPGSVIETGSRIELRRPTGRDLQPFVQLVRASRSLHRPWVAPPDDHDAFMQYLRRIRSARHEGFLICIKSPGGGPLASDGECIAGVINLNEIIRGNFQSASLSYYAFVPHAGTGCMTVGMELVLKHAFRTMKLHRLEANIQPGNTRSIELVKRCGFIREGFSPRFLKIDGKWRDHERWAIVTQR